RLGDIHRRTGSRMRLCRAARPIHTCTEELFQYVVLVGREYQATNRQTHFTGNMAGKNIAEIAGWHTERDFAGTALVRGSQPAPEVIDYLRGDARPVDGVDRTQAIRLFEFEVARQRLHDVLTVVEHALHRDIVDIGILQRIHLRPLEIAHSALRGQHAYGDTTLATHGVFGRRPRVAGRGTQDIQSSSPVFQHILEDLTQKLHGHVFEGERR